MGELPIVDALRDKRSELVGSMSRLEQQLAQHRGSLTHLDATMRLFRSYVAAATGEMGLVPGG